MKDVSAYETLSKAIWAFANEVKRDGSKMTYSLSVVLDPPSFAALKHSYDPMMGGQIMANGNVRIMDAIIMVKRIEATP